MNRRIRKKLHRGEFNTLGFEVQATFDPPLQDVDAFLDEFIAFCEANCLCCGGGMDDASFGQFITRIKRGRRIGANRFWWVDVDATEDDRWLIHGWLVGHGASRISVSNLKGAWS